MKVSVKLIMVIALSGVQFSLKSNASLQNYSTLVSLKKTRPDFSQLVTIATCEQNGSKIIGLEVAPFSVNVLVHVLP